MGRSEMQGNQGLDKEEAGQGAAGWAPWMASLMDGSFMDPQQAWRRGVEQARGLGQAMWDSPEDAQVRWLDSSESAGASAPRRRARLFRPASAATGAPLTVMLHGCMQDAKGFAKLTRMDELAAAEGFFVLYPEQEGSANAMQCWNWPSEANQERLGGEPESVAELIRQTQAICGSAPGRTRLVGLSAGAALGAAVACLWPDLVGSAAFVAGPDPFCAQDLRSALDAMSRGPRPGSESATAAKAALSEGRPGRAARLPILVVQGAADKKVHPGNGLAMELGALALNQSLGAFAGPSRPEALMAEVAGGSVKSWRGASGALAACSVSPAELAHAWSGGVPSEPFSQAGFDQSRLALDFFEAAESGAWEGFEPSALAERLWGGGEPRPGRVRLPRPLAK